MTPNQPAYIPIVLPNDAATLEQMPPQAALMISAVYGANPRLRGLVRNARERATTLLVDPKTPYFQFEGYMSMPDYRALPYSSGRHTLGTLWEPARFGRREARRDLIDSVFAVQRKLGADIMLAPYFYVPHSEHAWLEVSRACATEAIAASTDRPVGVPVTVDIDALIDPDHRARIAAVYTDIQAALFWVTIVNYDERRADPRDACTVMSFVDTLVATGVPVVLSHVGRTGLLAIAGGAAGYAAGTCGLETHPRSFFREMMGSRPANSYYLHEGLVHTPVRTAEACLRLDEADRHPTCDCVACKGDTAISRMVSRRLALHAVLRRLTEVESLVAIDPQGRRAYLVDRFSRARNRSEALAEALEAKGPHRIGDGESHYLEVLREAAGGPPATIPSKDAPGGAGHPAW